MPAPIYHPAAFSKSEASHLFETIRAMRWDEPTIRQPFTGNMIPLPRLTMYFGDPGTAYTYSGIRNIPRRWSESMQAMRDAMSARCGAHLNSILVNLYRSGRDHVGWHADDEREMDPEAPIVSVSLGAPRKFQTRSKRTGTVETWTLGDGDVLIMPPGFQATHEHRIAQDKSTGERINLTGRRVR